MMARKACNAFLLSVLMLTLGACSSDSNKVETVNPNIYPTKYKQQIIATLRNLLDDPTHVRNGSISDPLLMPVGNDQRYAVCMRFTERDVQSGQYDVSDTRIAYFFGGDLNQLVKAKDDQCAKAAYKPFPEVEKMCLVAHCP
jgi:hypothetical protein